MVWAQLCNFLKHLKHIFEISVLSHVLTYWMTHTQTPIYIWKANLKHVKHSKRFSSLVVVYTSIKKVFSQFEAEELWRTSLHKALTSTPSDSSWMKHQLQARCYYLTSVLDLTDTLVAEWEKNPSKVVPTSGEKPETRWMEVVDHQVHTLSFETTRVQCLGVCVFGHKV